MFIIVEGPDAAGKSSMLDALDHHLEVACGIRAVHHFHKGRPLEETRRWVLNEYVLSIDDLATSGACIVADRWHWGEVTYAPLKRPHTNKDGYGLLGRAGWRWVELFLLSRGATTWILSQPLDVLRARLEARGDDFVSSDELGSIVERYEFGETVAPSVVERLIPDPNEMSSLRAIARAVVDRAGFSSRQTFKLRTEYPEYIGPVTPKALLLGDRRNVTAKYGEETRLPFMPVDGNSGEFLLDSLPERVWPRVGIVNANELGDGERLHGLWSALGYPRVISLGREAENAAIAAGIEFEMAGTLAHPQYVRRFHAADKTEYGMAIAHLANGEQLEGSAPWILR